MKRLLLLFTFIHCLVLQASKSHVNTGVVPNFIVSKDSICSKEYVLITDLTIGNATNYNWNFGKNAFPATAIGKGPFFVKYTSAGYKTITLTIDGNITKIKDSALFVKLSPTAMFAVNDTDQCINNNIYFYNNLSLNADKFQWWLGDGNTLNTKNITHSYSQYGNYKITLKANTNFNCSDTFTTWVNVFKVPKANFSISNASQCLNENNFKIINTTQSYKPYTTIFLLGDGNGRLEDSFNYKYDLSGQYSILLKVSAGSGCQDTITKIVNVLENPKSNFTINNANQCLNTNKFEFSNNTLNANISKWLFGDSNYDTSTNAKHQYSKNGIFKVQLISKAENFCVDTILSFISVYPSPVSNFKINDSAQCLNNNLFIFEATSIIANGNITNSWILPNGNEEIKNIYQDIYGVPGSFNIKLLARSDKNCTDTIVKSIIVYNNPNPFFIIDSVNEKSVYLEAVNKLHQKYEWIISDGTTNDNFSFLHTFNANGTFKIQLTVTDINGCVDSSYYLMPINAIEFQNLKNEILLFPNPTTKNCVLKIILEKQSNIAFTLYNSLGQQMYNEKKSNFKKGIYFFNIPFETNQWAKGIYWLKINIGQYSKIEKIILK